MTGGVFMAVVLIPLLILPGAVSWEVLYLPLVLATMLVVRSVPAEPGAILRRRTARRLLVGLITLTSVALVTVAQGGAGQSSTGWLLIVLVLLDVALGRGTRRLAAATDEAVDEREEELRNRSHRISYGILALVLGGALLTSSCGSFATRRWIWDALHGGAPIAIAQLAFFLPAMTLAWLEPDAVDSEPRRGRGSRRELLAPVMLVATLLVPFVLAATIFVLPVHTTTSTDSSPAQSGGRRCVEIEARSSIGIGMGAVLPMHGVACGDGTAAREEWGFNQSDCNPHMTDSVTVITRECTRHTTADGTMHFTYAVTVQSIMLPLFKRDLSLRIAIDRDGRVVEFS
ncbi:MAG: hypothetical protein ACYDGR_07980 [Candidatus Dormibacteria bacterium]